MATKDFLKYHFLSSFQIWLLFKRVLILIMHNSYYTQPISKGILSDSNIPEKKLLSSQSDVYRWFKTVFKHLERICQCIALGNRFLTMPHRTTGENVFYQMQHLPLLLILRQALKHQIHGLMWIALHFTACKQYLQKLAFI